MTAYDWPDYFELGTTAMDRAGRYRIQVCRCGWQIEYDSDTVESREVVRFLGDHLDECPAGRAEFVWRYPDRARSIPGLTEEWLGVPVAPTPKRSFWPWRRLAYDGPGGGIRTRFLFLDEATR